jgi:hypothetical protein
MAKENGSSTEKKEHDVVPVKTCGVVMPISSIGKYSEGHWKEVKAIIFEAVESAGFAPKLVSDADDVGIIHNRIVQNIYENPILICDVSGKNPNVMFELGLRLAFDKATIIIKDSDTDYSFDTSPIEHLSYPTDLRYQKITEFKLLLSEKISKTHEASLVKGYSTFLQSFIKYKPTLETKEVGMMEYFDKQTEMISRRFDGMEARISTIGRSKGVGSGRTITYLNTVPTPEWLTKLMSALSEAWLFDVNKDIKNVSGTADFTDFLRFCHSYSDDARKMISTTDQATLFKEFAKQISVLKALGK